MAAINSCFQRLKRTYIFSLIEEKIDALHKKISSDQLINLSIGDIALPLVPSAAQAMSQAVLEMGTSSGLKGYGPSNGYLFLREAIANTHFASLQITPDEIFISDGINTDITNILDLFSLSCSVGIPDPTYPAYLDATILSGRTKIITLPCLETHQFHPHPPTKACDLIYLCSPNNPTGVAMNRALLTTWVDYALKHKAIIFFDHAYEAFISSVDVPHSIFEIPGAKECAIEFRSFSKSAGFTGLRCSYTILPKDLKARYEDQELSLHTLWHRRQAAKSNGVAYPIQKGALATLLPQGQSEIKTQIHSYLAQAKALKQGLTQLGLNCYGGIDSPYIWVKTPEGKTSWEFFDELLMKCHLISIPGIGFGKYGEGFVRFSAFTTPEKIDLALKRINQL
ncbi:MAG TPA: LL-diaminopimelate aminotransferase [Candidatus Rhabdochlamydia sp.]|jgi:LL-diaminopimelate aminotransferase|nr:LL-diaminopimelate aminotransferase [Candidatus Rhabdochlamydia sp.]